MKFSSFIILTAAGLAIAAPITPVSTEKKLTIEPVAVAKRQMTLDPVVDAAHGKLPAPIKRATPNVSSLGALTDAVPGGLPVKRADIPDPGLVDEPVGGFGLAKLPVKKRQLGGLIPSGSSTDDSSESAEAKEPKTPKEPKEPSTVTDGTTEIDDGTAESSTSSAASALGGLPIGKRQLEGITGMLSPKPADTPAPEEEASAEGEDDAPEDDASEDDAPEDDASEAEEAAPPADKSALAGILKRQLDGLTKGLFPSPTPDAEPAAKDADANGEAVPEPAAEEGTEESAEEEDAPEEAETAEETAPAKKEKTGGLLGSLGM